MSRKKVEFPRASCDWTSSVGALFKNKCHSAQREEVFDARSLFPKERCEEVLL